MAGRFRAFREWTFEHAPASVLANLGLAIAAAWTRLIPGLVLYLLAAITAILAVMVATRQFWRDFASKEELGFRRNRDLLWYGVAARAFRMAITAS
jgi:hypothetical protein